jgi:hypothetical protein
MALAKCRECGHEVSTEAKTCPGCGVSKPTKRSGPSTGLLVVVFLILLFVFASMFTTPSVDREPSASAPPSERDRHALALLAGAQALQREMRNPSSFELLEAIYGDGGAVCYRYRAQNGFGGMNVERVVIGPRATFVRQESKDGAAFAQSWNSTCAGHPDLAPAIRHNF